MLRDKNKVRLALKDSCNFNIFTVITIFEMYKFVIKMQRKYSNCYKSLRYCIMMIIILNLPK